jgi:hypothetical protein
VIGHQGTGRRRGKALVNVGHIHKGIITCVKGIVRRLGSFLRACGAPLGIGLRKGGLSLLWTLIGLAIKKGCPRAGNQPRQGISDDGKGVIARGVVGGEEGGSCRPPCNPRTGRRPTPRAPAGGF